MTNPFEADDERPPQPVESELVRPKHSKNTKLHESGPGFLDRPNRHTEDLRYPGRFAPASRPAHAVLVVEAAKQVTKHRGDIRPPARLGEKAENRPGHRYGPPRGLGNLERHRDQLVLAKPQQPGPLQCTDGPTDVLPAHSANQPVEFIQGESWFAPSLEGAPPGLQLMTRQPDANVSKGDVSRPQVTPHRVNAVLVDEAEPAVRLCCLDIPISPSRVLHAVHLRLLC